MVNLVGLWKGIEGKCLINVLETKCKDEMSNVLYVRLITVKGRLRTECERTFKSVMPKREWVMTVYGSVPISVERPDNETMACVRVTVKPVWSFNEDYGKQAKELLQLKAEPMSGMYPGWKAVE